MGLSQNKEDPRVVVVITPDKETAEVDAVLIAGKELRDSLNGLSKEELVAKYKKPLADDEDRTYFADQKLKRAIELVLLEKKMVTAEEIATLKK